MYHQSIITTASQSLTLSLTLWVCLGGGGSSSSPFSFGDDVHLGWMVTIATALPLSFPSAAISSPVDLSNGAATTSKLRLLRRITTGSPSGGDEEEDPPAAGEQQQQEEEGEYELLRRIQSEYVRHITYIYHYSCGFV